MEKIDLAEIYKNFRWEERLKNIEKVYKTGVSDNWGLRIARGCLIAFSVYIILILIISILNKLLYYVSNGEKYIKCIELYLIIIVPAVFLGLAFMLLPAIIQKK